MLDLNKLSDKVDKALEKETTESLNDFLSNSLRSLEKALAEMSQEDRDRIVKEVERIGFNGPTFDEYLKNLSESLDIEKLIKQKA